MLKNELKNSISKKISTYQRSEIKTNNRNIFQWSISVAAAIIIIAAAGLFFYSPNKNAEQPAKLTIKKDIAPGGNKAILTLSNGKKISLTDASNGQLAENSGIRITKTADGQLIYTVLGESRDLNPKHNTIETPKGGQYQVILPDGSKVWLNAASSLRYPVSFEPLSKRQVELSGEAYFEVAKDKTRPFLVSTNGQEVEVLGTHFNINGYADEPSVKTTLLEGSIKVLNRISDNSQLLQPGQQSTITGNTTTVSDVDIQEVIAWKNGHFRFDDENLEGIMRKISRWYDIDVVWQDPSAKNERFAAVTSRFNNVSKLLRMLEQTGDVKFEIEGRKIRIKKKSN